MIVVEQEAEAVGQGGGESGHLAGDAGNQVVPGGTARAKGLQQVVGPGGEPGRDLPPAGHEVPDEGEPVPVVRFQPVPGGGPTRLARPIRQQRGLAEARLRDDQRDSPFDGPVQPAVEALAGKDVVTEQRRVDPRRLDRQRVHAHQPEPLAEQHRTRDPRPDRDQRMPFVPRYRRARLRGAAGGGAVGLGERYGLWNGSVNVSARRLALRDPGRCRRVGGAVPETVRPVGGRRHARHSAARRSPATYPKSRSASWAAISLRIRSSA